MFCRTRPAWRGLLNPWLICGVLSVLAMGLGGCMVGPNFRAPQTPVPKDWIGTTTAPSTQPGETQHYIRLAYSGINVENIEEGLTKFKKFIES